MGCTDAPYRENCTSMRLSKEQRITQDIYWPKPSPSLSTGTTKSQESLFSSYQELLLKSLAVQEVRQFATFSKCPHHDKSISTDVATRWHNVARKFIRETLRLEYYIFYMTILSTLFIRFNQPCWYMPTPASPPAFANRLKNFEQGSEYHFYLFHQTKPISSP